MPQGPLALPVGRKATGDVAVRRPPSGADNGNGKILPCQRERQEAAPADCRSGVASLPCPGRSCRPLTTDLPTPASQSRSYHGHGPARRSPCPL